MVVRYKEHIRRRNDINDMAIPEQYFEGGYRCFGRGVWEEHYSRKKDGCYGWRTTKAHYRWCVLRICERCHRMSGKQLISYGGYELGSFFYHGYFCLGCRNTLGALAVRFKENHEIEKLIKKFRSLIHEHKKHGRSEGISGEGNGGCAVGRIDA